MSDEEEFGLEDLWSTSEQLRDVEAAFALIYGPEDTGKSSAAASMSAKQRSKAKSGKKVYDDLGWFGFDRFSTAFCGDLGISLPYVLDVPHLMSKPKRGEKRPHVETIEEILEFGAEALIDMVVKKSLRAVVVDTLTNFGLMVERRADELADEGFFNATSGNMDKWAKGRWIQEQYRELYNLCAALPCAVIFTAHSRAKSEESDAIKAAKKRKKEAAKEGPGDWDAIIDLPGAWGETRNLFTSNNSIIFSTSTEGDDPSNLEYRLHPGGGNGFMGKNKWRSILKPVEEPNLYKIFQRIKKGK